MSLNEVLAALSDNEIKIEILSKIVEENVSDEMLIIEFEAEGYEALNSELLSREVDKITINASMVSPSVSILLKNIT